MLRAILAVLWLAGLPMADAASTPPRLANPVPGAPGTPTPTPYPQITPSIAKATHNPFAGLAGLLKKD